MLGIDLKAAISPALDLPETIAQIHHQGGLAVASHPHIMKTEWGKNTLSRPWNPACWDLIRPGRWNRRAPDARSKTNSPLVWCPSKPSDHPGCPETTHKSA